ncbi:terminase small subunit [Labrys neptuniae]|uniref:terminase small subunit n=1 Tax=Labrys neptuniae TaxID=376174 RepID=UPI00288FB679|nr:terminase small subunit [Labrys neptuniae]MDT3377414.1 terminase small subunit [Labrys neptuniae]
MTPRQSRFVDEYLLDLNATKAAIRAGYSKNTANEQAAQLLGKSEIIAAIDRAKAERAQRTKIDADWVLKRLVDEISADIADIYDENNRLKPVKEWPLIWRQGLIAGVEIQQLFGGRGPGRQQIGELVKAKMSDRVRRLEMIGKHVGVKAFEERLAVSGSDGLADRLERARKRLERDRAGIID